MSRTTKPRPPRAFRARRAAAALLSVVLGVTGAMLGASPAYAATDVTGRLVDQDGDPVLGLRFILRDNGQDTETWVESDPATGEFTIPDREDGPYFFIIGENGVTGGERDDSGAAYANYTGGFFFLPGDAAQGDIELQRYANISGTITNWSPLMGDVNVEVLQDDGGSWVRAGFQVSTDGTFDIPAILDDGDYTIRFWFDPSSRAPYLDAYLGGEFDDIAGGTILDGVAGTSISVTATVPPAALISGVVTAGGDPVEGIYVSNEHEDDDHSDHAVTDMNGEYTLRARPGEVYAVFADDYAGIGPYASEVYDDACACDFTEVVSTLGVPADDIDFELEIAPPAIVGQVVAGDLATGSTLVGVSVHLDRRVAGAWTEVGVESTDVTGGVVLDLPDADGEYRLRFVDAGVTLRVTEGFGGPGVATVPAELDAGCALETGDMDPAWVNTPFGLPVAYFFIVAVDPAGGCAPPATGGESGGTVTPPRPRPGATTGSTVEATPAATPTPTPTATPSVSPRPTTSPAPEATEPAEPTSASAPDLWWLLWVGLALLVILVVGGVVLIFRRR